jgi:flagellar assembly protein FliH
MLCTVADSDVVTDDFNWLSVGSSAAAARRAAPAIAVSHQGSPAGAEPENAALQRRLAELESQSALKVEQARQNGLEQGLRQAKQEAGAEMQAALDRLARTVQDVAQVKRKVRAEAETELVKLSLAIARRILHRELTADPQSLRGVVYAALQHLKNREITKIRVFPAAIPAVRAALERNGGLAALEIVGDGLLPPGGLVFETSLGELDASVDTQLQEIERGFTDRLQIP